MLYLLFTGSLSCILALCFNCTSATAQVNSAFPTEQLAENNPLEYNCTVPDGLKPKLEIQQKGGKRTVEDAHALYRSSHSEGWYAVFNCYSKTGLTESRGLYPLPIRQEIRFTAVAREIGATDAKAVLLRMELALGSSDLIAMVNQELVSDHMKAMAPPMPPPTPLQRKKTTSPLNSKTPPIYYPKTR